MAGIIILGGEGMLGHKMVQTLALRYPDVACTTFGSLAEPPLSKIEFYRQVRVYEGVDAMNLAALEALVREEAPRQIINCIGIIKQRQEARAPVLSITLNSLLPHLLAQWAQAWGGRVIHFSTDCVFDGRRGGYTEDDASSAEDLYGKSKSLGEVTADNALTLRTSIIGREILHFASLLEWFLRQRGRSIYGYRRVIYSGVTTNYLADLVARLVAEHSTLSGLYQVTAPAIAKYELLSLLKDAYQLDVDIVPEDEIVSDRSMIGDRFLAATGFSQPTWDTLIQRLANDPNPYEQWR